MCVVSESRGNASPVQSNLAWRENYGRNFKSLGWDIESVLNDNGIVSGVPVHVGDAARRSCRPIRKIDHMQELILMSEPPGLDVQ